MTESQLLLNACRIITDRLKQEFANQGHTLSGTWEESITSQEIADGQVEILALSYGMIVDAGITPDRIPFGGQGTGGGENQYIIALTKYWLLRKPGISQKAALKLAFATANVQKQEGMSTIASQRFSNTGERQHFINAIEVLFNDYLNEWIFEGLNNIILSEDTSPQVMYL